MKKAIIWSGVNLAEAAVVKSGNGSNIISSLAPILIGFFVSETMLFKENK